MDSNFILDTLKDRSGFGSDVLNTVLSDGIFVFTPVSIWEIARDPVFGDFASIFSQLPSMIFNDEKSIVEAEIQLYETSLTPQITDIATNLNVFSPIQLHKELKKRVNKQGARKYKELERKYFQEIRSTRGITVDNFTEGGVLIFAYELLARINFKFCKLIRTRGTELDIKRFGSMVSKSVLYHSKFAKPNRKGLASDLSDILISSYLPYVDVFLTERGVANDIREARDRFGHFQNLETKIMKDLRN